MRKSKGVFFVIVLVFFVIVSSGCNKETEGIVSTGGPLNVYVRSTFSESTLENIPVTLECEGVVYEDV